MPTVEQLSHAADLIKQGKPQDAWDFIDGVIVAEKFIADSAAAVPAPPPPPRPLEAVLHDFLAQVTTLLGNPAVLELGLEELRHVAKLPPKA